MADLKKHRDELRVYAIDFVDDLAAGDSLVSSPPPQLKLSRRSGSTDVDKTDEFGDVNVAINGPTKVQFSTNPAVSQGVQVDGVYHIYCKASTALGEILIPVPAPTLEVSSRPNV